MLPVLTDIDSCVTDPPYGLSFMGKTWDYDVPGVDIWSEVLCALKPGAHLLSFFGSRTYHRGVIPIEDAGFEIRDQLMWLYGSGFPKSHNIGKAVDKLQGNEREVVGTKKNTYDGAIRNPKNHKSPAELSNIGKWGLNKTPHGLPKTKGNSEYEGWGTALKPAHEPIVMARKPFKGTVANNVLEHGTGGINIDECRVDGGRFPANVMHDGSEEVLEIFPQTNPSKKTYRGLQHSGRHGGLAQGGKNYKENTNSLRGHEDNGGSASRYFYCAKSNKKDRDEGLDSFSIKQTTGDGGLTSPKDEKGNYIVSGDKGTAGKYGSAKAPEKNNHPTVKPTELMRYLCRLVTPKGGVILDPFMGSGSTGKAAVAEGFGFVGIEMSQEYFDIACARIEAEHKKIQQRLI